MPVAMKVRFWLTATAAAELAQKEGDGYNVQWENGAPYIEAREVGAYDINQEHIEEISLRADIANGGLLRGIYITEEKDVFVSVDTLPDGSQSIEAVGNDLAKMLAFYSSVRAGEHRPCESWELSREERLGAVATISLEKLMKIFIEAIEKSGCKVRMKKGADDAAPTEETSREAAKTLETEPAETKPPDQPRSA